jgi:hypothetical protein
MAKYVSQNCNMNTNSSFGHANKLDVNIEQYASQHPRILSSNKR